MKTECKKCGKFITNNNYKKHVKSCSDKKSIKIEKIWIQSDGKYKCPHCNKCFTHKGIGTHIWRMHGSGKKHQPTLGKKAWNKGLTNETDNRVNSISKKVSKTMKRQFEEGKRTPSKMSKEKLEILSKRMSENNPGGKSKWYEVSGKKVQGKWERNFALYCNENNIKWERCKPWKYIRDKKIKNYTPDFYLPEKDLFIEIKGYWWGNDKEKMELVIEQHKDKNIIILQKEEMKKLMMGELVW